jgi:hypothetical protein
MHTVVQNVPSNMHEMSALIELVYYCNVSNRKFIGYRIGARCDLAFPPQSANLSGPQHQTETLLQVQQSLAACEC